MTPAAEKMIAALALCPCCKATQQQANTPDDGIPDGFVHESVFGCGSRVLVNDEGSTSVGMGCPWPLDEALYEIQQSLDDGDEGDDQ